jgi:dephospho-CoA kinase
MTLAKLVAITGTIGSGKSLIGKLLSEKGFTVLDADHVVHELYCSDTAMKSAVEAQFGADILAEEGGIDRGKLAAIVFKDDEARLKLEAVVHPAVIAECRRRIAQHAGERIVFLLAPLLFEAGLEGQCDEVWTVITDEEVLKRRIAQRDKLSLAEVERRLSAQLPQSTKAARSHHIIDNSFTRRETARQLDKLLQEQGLQ